MISVATRVVAAAALVSAASASASVDLPFGLLYDPNFVVSLNGWELDTLHDLTGEGDACCLDVRHRNDEYVMVVSRIAYRKSDGRPLVKQILKVSEPVRLMPGQQISFCDPPFAAGLNIIVDAHTIESWIYREGKFQSVRWSNSEAQCREGGHD